MWETVIATWPNMENVVHQILYYNYPPRDGTHEINSGLVLAYHGRLFSA